MKRILLGSSALSILAVAGAASVSAQASRVCEIDYATSVYLCQQDSDSPKSIQMDLTATSNDTEFLFQGGNSEVNGVSQFIRTGGGVDEFTVLSTSVDPNTGDTLPSGSVTGLALDTGDGDDVLMLSAKPEDINDASGGFVSNSSINMGTGNDKVLVGGNLSSASEMLDLGEGNDELHVTGNLGQNVTAGDGDDIMINTGSVQITDTVDMGMGNDTVQTSNSFTGKIQLGEGDDTMRVINVAPQFDQPGNQPNVTVMDGGEGYDRLELQGSVGGYLALSQTNNFETLIKSGGGTWTLSQDDAISSAQFTDGIYNTEGGINFTGVNRSELSTFVVNSGTLGGEVMLSSTSDYDATAGGPVPLHNTSTGTIAADILFSDFNDVFINDGRIADERSDDPTLDVVIDMGDGSDEFRNGGAVSGRVDLGDGEDRFALASDELFDTPPAGTVTGGNGFDTIELAGVGGRLMEINCSSCAINSFEHLDVTSGAWSFAADQDFNGDITVTGGDLTMNTAITGKNLVVDGGNVNLSGSYQGLQTTVNSGTLEILNGLLTSPLTVAQGGSVKGYGVVKGETIVHGNITPADFNDADGNAIGVLEIEGNFDVTETGKVTINVDPQSNEWDRFDVSGFITIDDGALIEVVPTSALAEGQYFEIDIANAGLIGGEFTIDPNSAFTDYQIVYDENDKVKILMGAAAAPVVFSTATVSGNGAIWEHLTDTAQTGAIKTFAEAVENAYSSDPAPADSPDMDEISPEWYDAVYGLARSYATNFGEGLAKRLGDKEWCGTMQGAGEADCRAHRGDGGDVWGSLIAYSHNNSKSAVSETEGTVAGLMIGADQRMGIATFGIAGGYGMLGQDVNESGSAAGWGANIGGYFSLPMEVVNLDGDISYTYGTSTSERIIDISDAVNGTSNYDSVMEGAVKTHTINAGLRLTQEYKNQAGIEFQPTVGFRINRTAKPGFTETAQTSTDGTPLALVVDDSSHTDVTGEIGVAVRKAFTGGNGGTFVPEVRAKLSRMLMGKEVETTARFAESADGAQDFVITTDQASWAMDLGAGINYRTNGGMTVFGDYDYSGGDSVTEHKGSLGVRYDF